MLGDHRGHAALDGDRPGVGGITRLLVGRQRLPGQRGLVHPQVVPVQQHHVGGDDVPQPDPHHVPGHQPGGVDLRPFAVPAHGGAQRQLALQRRHRVRGGALLPEPDPGVEPQQYPDDDHVRPVPQDRRQDQGHLDHPRDRPPEKRSQLRQRAAVLLRDRVRPGLSQAAFSFLTRQALPAGLQPRQHLTNAGARLPRRRGITLPRCPGRPGGKATRRDLLGGTCGGRGASAASLSVAGHPSPPLLTLPAPCGHHARSCLIHLSSPRLTADRAPSSSLHPVLPTAAGLVAGGAQAGRAG